MKKDFTRVLHMLGKKTGMSALYWDTFRKCWIPAPTPAAFYNGIYDVPQCTSVQKFRRLLRQWSEYLPPGTVFLLVGKSCVLRGCTT